MKTLHTIYTSFAKRFIMLLMVLMTIGIGSAWGEDYELVSTITDGEYVIGAVKGSAGTNTTIYAINNTDGSSWKSATETTPSNGKISNPASSIVWTLTKTGNNSFTLKNGSVYLTIATTTGSGSVRSNSTSAGTIYFASTGSSSTFEISGVSTFTVSSGNQVGYNIGNGYRQYAERGHSTTTTTGSISTQFRFYKKIASTFTVKCQSNNANYGTVSQASVTNVANNTSISAEGNVLTIGETEITATPNAQDANYTYAFSEWTEIPTGGKVTENITVTANFTRTARALTNYRTTCNTEPSYSVTYKENGATSGNVPTDANSPYEENAEVTVLENTGTLAKTGYTFSGWNTEANGTGTTYTAGATFPITENTTLYAQWTAYTITWTINPAAGGSLSSTSGTSTTVTPDAAYTYANPAYTVTSGSATVSQSDNTFTATPTANCTIQINMVEKPKWTVTFDAGEHGTCATASLTESTADAGVELPSVTPASGYRFIGWSTTSSATTADAGTAGDTYKPASNITLYAVYKQLHTITWMVGSNSVHTEEVANATGVTQTPPDPANNAIGNCANAFMGWSETPLGSTEGQSAPADLCTAAQMKDKYTSVTGDKTFYAVFATKEGSSETTQMYKLVTSISGEKEYIFATGNSAGSVNGLTCDANSNLTATSLTVKVSDGLTYIETPASNNVVWNITGSSSSYNAQNKGQSGKYLRCYGTSPYAVIETSAYVLYWSDSEGLYGKSNSGKTSYYLYYNTSTNEWGAANNANGRVYAFEKSEVTVDNTTYSNYVTNCCALAPATNLAVSGTTDKSATLTWTAPSPTTGITKLEVRDENGIVKVNNLEADATTATIYGLSECTEYTFCIASVGEDCEVVSNTITAQPYSGAKTVTFVYGNEQPNTTFTTDCDNQSTALPTPTRSGYRFMGWFTAESGGTKIDYNPYTPTEDITLFAHWEKEYTVTYDANGGSTTCANGNYIEGETVTLCTSTPSKTGYTFAGWTYSPEVTITDGKFTMPASNVTITAQWTITQYTVTWNPNGGKWGESTANIVHTYDYGATINRPADPTRDGYRFTGWNTTVASTMPATNITYTAQWKQNYTITFHDGDDTTPWTQTIDAESIDLNTYVGTHACGEYNFAGWSTDATPYNDQTANITTWVTGTYTPTASIDLYAVYVKGDLATDFTLNCDGGVYEIWENGTNQHMAGRQEGGGNKFYTTEYWDQNKTGSNGAPFTITKVADQTYTLQNADGQYITGNTYDEDDLDIEDTWENADKYKWTISNGINGTWRFTNKAATSYALVYYNNRYFELRSASSVTAGNTTTYDLELTPAQTNVYQSNPNCGPYTITFETHGGVFIQGNYAYPTAVTSNLTGKTTSKFPAAELDGYTFAGWKDGTPQDEINYEPYLKKAGDNLVVSSNKTYHAVYYYYDEEEDIDWSEEFTTGIYADVNGIKYFLAGTPDRGTMSSTTDCGYVSEVTITPGTGENAGKYKITVNGVGMAPEAGETDLVDGTAWWTITETSVGSGEYKISGEDKRNIVLLNSSFGHYSYYAGSSYGAGYYYPRFGKCLEHHWTSNPVDVYTMTWKIDEYIHATTTVQSGKTITALPTNPLDNDLGCCADKFIGWTASAAQTISKADVFTTLAEAKAKFPNITENKTFRAVFATAAQGVGTSIADFSEMGYENATAVTDPIILGDGEGRGDATITLAKAPSSKNDAKYYDDGEAVRVYAGSTITISSTYDGATIKSVTFEFSASDTEGDNTISVTSGDGTYSEGTWTGDATAVIFTIGGSTGHRRIASITVTTGVAGSQYTNYVTQCTTLSNPALSGGSVSDIAVDCGDFSTLINSQAIVFSTMQDLTCPVTFEVIEGDFLISTARDRAAQYQSKVKVVPYKTGENLGKLKNVYVRANAIDHNENFTGRLKVTSDEITEDVIIDLIATVTCDKFTLTTVDHLGNETEFGTYFAGEVIDTEPTPSSDACSENYTFDGWSTSAVEYGSVAYSKVTFPYTMPAEDVTFYPVYQCNKTADYHRVTYDLGANNWAGDYLIAASETMFANGSHGGTTDVNCIGGNNSVVNPGVDLQGNVVKEFWGNQYKVAFVHVVDGYYVLQTQDGKYNYIGNNASSADLSATESLTTASVNNHPLSIIFDETNNSVRITNPFNTAGLALKWMNGTNSFRFGKSPASIYLYKKSPLYTTSLICGTIETEATPMVTSTAGQTVKVNVPITLTASLGNKTTITGTSDNAAFTVTALNDITAGDHTIAVNYTPTKTTDGIETANITLKASAGNNASTTFQVTGRHLPENFVIAAKWGDNWYALPANCVKSSDSKQGILIDVDDINNPTSATAPTTTKYGLRGVKPGRQADFGQSILFTERVSDNQQRALFQNSEETENIWVSAQYENYDGSNPTYYEWIPSTNDLTNYTFTHSASSRKLGVNENGVFGAYTTDVQVRLLTATFYEQVAVQVIKWKANSVIVMYTGAETTATTQVGTNAATDAQTLPDQKITHGIYELTTTQSLTENAGKILTMCFGTTQVKVEVPLIVSEAVTASANGHDVVILNGGKLTAAATSYSYNTIYVYGGGKLAIPEGAQLGVNNIILRAGGVATNDAGQEAIYQYIYPQVDLKGTLTSASQTFLKYEYVTDYDHWYHLVLPFNASLSTITYPQEYYGENVKADNKGSWQIKRYAGEIRATGNYDAWKDIETEDATSTTAGKGYIFWGAPKKVTIGGDTQRQKWGIQRITMNKQASTAKTEENGNKKISDLSSYATVEGNSGADNDQGWNLVGNPYMVNLTGLNSQSLQIGQLIHETDASGNWTGKWQWDNTSEQTGLRYVTIPSDHFETYEAKPMTWFTESNPMITGRSFFIQIAGEATDLVFDVNKKASLMPALLAENNDKPVDIETGIVLSNETLQDEVNFWIKDGKTNDYEYNADYPKTPNNNNFNIYGVHTNGDLSWVAISPELAAESMPIGYQVPAAGTYTLSVSETYYSDDLHALYVTDHAMSPELTVDLMNAPYEFSVNQAETNNERFTVSVILKTEEDDGGGDVGTGVDNATNNYRPYKFFYQDKLYILRNGIIYDAMGKQVKTINK